MPFRFGILGAGGAAALHVPAMRTLRGIEVAAIADVDEQRAAAFATRYAIPAVFGSVEALLARAPIDAVAVLSPHHLPLPAVRLAAERGVHALVEKALAPTVEDADAMIEVCRQRKIVLGGILQYRFTPGARQLRQMVQDGSLGRIFCASVCAKFRRSADYYTTAPWRGRKAEAGGGALTTQAIHTLDLLIHAMGMPRRVATVSHQIEVEDLAAGVLEYGPDCLAVVQTTTAAVPEQPPQPLMTTCAVALQAAVSACFFAAYYPLVAQLVPASHIHLTISVVSISGMLLGGGLTPLLVGHLAETWSFSGAILIVGALTVLSPALLLVDGQASWNRP